MSFQKTVSIVALGFLIIALCVVAYMSHMSNKKVKYPPVTAECPDFWEVKEVEDHSVCVNTKQLGKQECHKQMRFDVSPWTGETGLCRKKNWARECDLSWDGITNMDLKC